MGVLAILISCVCWAIGSIFSRHAQSSPNPFMAAALQMLCGGVSLGLTALITGDFSRVNLSAISTHSWIAFVYLIVMGSFVGFSTFVWLIKNVPPALAATFAYVNPVVAVFLGWWLLDETLNARTAVATIIIITSVVIITVQKNRTRLAVPPRQAVGLIDPPRKPAQ